MVGGPLALCFPLLLISIKFSHSSLRNFTISAEPRPLVLHLDFRVKPHKSSCLFLPSWTKCLHQVTLPVWPEILETTVRDKPGELCSVLALPLDKWHWQSLPPPGPSDSTTIKRVGVGAREGPFQRCNYVNAWMSQFLAYTLARGFLFELLNLVLYKNFLTPFFKRVIPPIIHIHFQIPLFLLPRQSNCTLFIA